MGAGNMFTYTLSEIFKLRLYKAAKTLVTK